MKKKIFIISGVFSFVFLLGGIYIISTIQTSTSKLQDLIRLYQVEIHRKQLLIRIKNVQSDFNLRRTSHAKSIDTIIANVRSMENMARICFTCHHSKDVIERLNDLKKRIEEYKDLISRAITIRANRARVMTEDEKVFFKSDQILTEVDSMVHLATARLNEKTQSSLNSISKTNLMLFLVVAITPIFVAIIGLSFFKGLTRPVEILLTATRKIKGGNLDYRIEGLKDEFGEVAASFNEMTSRVEEYTKKLESQTIELESAHNEMSTFCRILKKIGMQHTLDGVCSFLMQELQPILNSQYMVLYFFNRDHNTLFSLSNIGVKTFRKNILIKNASKIIESLDKITISSKSPFLPPFLPDGFPTDKSQAIIPLPIQSNIYGAFVTVCTKECQCHGEKLNLVALILDQVSGSIRRAVMHQEEIRSLETRIERTSDFSGIIGKDQSMQVIYKLIEDIATTDTTVLIQGETGTGKEMVAYAIYRQSHRKENPFIVINCSAYPDTLLESELFGHEEGSFTGANRQKIGRFEQANGGTVFLDEVGEISLSAQVKLLRVLQFHQFERLGGEQSVNVDVRVLAATNKDLLQEVEKGNFREDLYYRLNIIPIQLPPLKLRPNDIPLLARHFQQKFASEQGKAVKSISREVMGKLLNYKWPGNVRELENIIEHAMVLSKDGEIDVVHLPSVLYNADKISPPSESPPLTTRTIVDNEKKLLKDVLEESNWNKTKAALRLGISRSTLYEKLKKYRISKPAVQLKTS